MKANANSEQTSNGHIIQPPLANCASKKFCSMITLPFGLAILEIHRQASLQPIFYYPVPVLAGKAYDIVMFGTVPRLFQGFFIVRDGL